MNIKNRFLCLSLSMLLLLMSVPAVMAEETAYDEHLVLRWYSESRDLNLEEDIILNAIQDRFNVTFEFIEPPADGSSEKLNLLMSVGEPLDLITAFSIDAVAKQWAQDDFILSLIHI